MTDFERELDEIFSDVSPRDRAEAALALDIATQVARLRQQRGLTQAQLAERLGKTQQAISKIENPTHAGHSLARLQELLAALDATVDVTIVPLEKLSAYQQRFVRKPVLEAGPARSAAEEGVALREAPPDPSSRPPPIGRGAWPPPSVTTGGPRDSAPVRRRRRLAWPPPSVKTAGPLTCGNGVVSLGNYVTRMKHREAVHA